MASESKTDSTTGGYTPEYVTKRREVENFLLAWLKELGIPAEGIHIPTAAQCDELAARFIKDHVIVWNLLSPELAARLADKVTETIRSASEFKKGEEPQMEPKPGETRVPGHMKHTLGAFMGCNLTSVTHSVVERLLRLLHYYVMLHICPAILEALAASPDHPRFTKSEGVVLMELESGKKKPVTIRSYLDRLMLRTFGSQVMAESYHRDEIEDKSLVPIGNDGFFFGGWLALQMPNNADQIFTMCKGTGRFGYGKGGGFKKISKAEAAEFKKRETRIKVPIGSMIVFLQNVAHCVTGSKKTTDTKPQIRYFGAAACETTEESIIPDVAGILKEGRPGYLKSGQPLAKYQFSKNHFACHPEMVEKYAERCVPECTEKRSRIWHVPCLIVMRDKEKIIVPEWDAATRLAKGVLKTPSSFTIRKQVCAVVEKSDVDPSTARIVGKRRFPFFKRDLLVPKAVSLASRGIAPRYSEIEVMSLTKGIRMSKCVSMGGVEKVVKRQRVAL